jgi:hypothetical protein
MVASLSIQTFQTAHIERAARKLLKNYGPLLVDIGPALGNGSGYCLVRIVSEGSPYNETEFGFILGREFQKQIHK